MLKFNKIKKRFIKQKLQKSMTFKARLLKEKKEKAEKKLRRLAKDYNVRKRILRRKKENVSQFPVGSASWFLEDLNRLFHLELKSLIDAEASTKATAVKVFGVYLREEPPTENKKIGKATVENGNITRETSGTNISYHLEDKIFIPCYNELAAYMLEYALQIIFGRTRSSRALKDYPNVKKALDRKFSKRFDLWIQQQKSKSNKSNTGSEWFMPDLTMILFQSVVNSIATDYKDAGLNKNYFLTKARSYQNNCSDIFVECVLQVGSWEQAMKDSIDFYLLMKPRSGKNLTLLLSLSKLVKKLQELGQIKKNDVINVLFTSLVPAAFDGTKDDIDQHWFDKDIQIGYVDTSDADWEIEHQELVKQGYNIIFIFSSMQSIDEKINKEINRNYKFLETNDIESEDFDPQKLEKILKYQCQIMVLDECDFGLRTVLSKAVLNKFKPAVKVHLSGSDLYAIRNLIKDTPVPNYYLRDAIQEDKDIENGVTNLPRYRCATLEELMLPFEDMTPAEMDEKGISRRLSQMYLTNVDKLLEKHKNDPDTVKTVRKYYRNAQTGLWTDGLGNEIGLLNDQEMRKFKKVLENLDNAGFGLLAHRNIFNTVPSMVGQLAFENYCKKNGWFDYDVKTGFEFKNAKTRQKAIREDWMGVTEFNPTGLRKTWFVTVAKMLRGATVPWSAVVRCDEFSDIKIGHQIDYRGQNAYGPDGVHFDIFDMNPFRRLRSAIELPKMSSFKGDKFKIAESSGYNRFLPWMIGVNSMKQAGLADCEDAYNNFRSLTHGFQNANLYNLDNVLLDKEDLEKIGTASRDGNGTDQRAGKKKKKKTGMRGNKINPTRDEKAEALKLIKNFANYIPLLQFVTKKNKINRTYYTLEDLLNFSPQQILDEWFRYVGLPKDISNEKILNWFNTEKFNEKLRIIANKVDRGLDVEEISQISKPKTGDVPVPYMLAKEIVNHIPEEFWFRSNLKIFDPSCGKGDFLKAINEKLLSIGFTKKKIAEILFYADSEEINILVTNKILDLSNGFSYTLQKTEKPIKPKKGSTAKEIDVYNKAIKNWDGELTDLRMKLENMGIKFDLFITNPPYQSTDEDGNRNDQAKNLWTKFVKLGHDRTKDDGIFTLVTPASWANSETADIGKGDGPNSVKFFKDYFQRYKTIALNINECKRHFNEGSSFSYFIVEKTLTDNFITKVKSDVDEFNIDLRNVHTLPRQLSKDNIDILEKVFYSNKEKMGWIGNNLPETKNADYSNNKDKNHTFKCYHTPASPYVFSDTQIKNHKTSKVMVSVSGEYKPYYDDGKLGYDPFIVLYVLKKGETLENLKSVLDHPLYKFVMDQTRFAGFLGPMLPLLPSLEFTKKWKYQEVYDAFNITQFQREKIDDWHQSKTN